MKATPGKTRCAQAVSKSIDWGFISSLTRIMALRVLLADESSTIKKVFQLSLQDFAVDVCSVSLGLDVLPVSRQFKPDIIFCDILLQKKSGYDACAELKNDPQFKSVPVVLMWSSFMEVDEDKLQAARADGKLEKPFDVKDLRKVIHDLVPRTRSQRLSGFLSFPKMPDMVEAGVGANAPIQAGPANEAADWNMESFDPIPLVNNPDSVEDFQEVPLPPPPRVDQLGSMESEEDEREAIQWSTKPLGRFQVDVPEGSHEELDVGIDEPEAEPVPHAPPPRINLSPPPPKMEAAAPQLSISQAELQKLVNDQARAIIESVAWKVVPDLATQIIERELKRLLAEKGT